MVEIKTGLGFDSSLSSQVINNLTKATPLGIDGGNFCYGPDFITAVAQYCLNKETLYTSTPFKMNILYYLNVFAVNLKLFNQTIEENVFSDQITLQKKNNHRIFFHGRSNGFPTPLGIKAFQRAKKLFPESEIWFGVDHDDSSTIKNQTPFMNPQFRASCYFKPKIVDRIIYLHPPLAEKERKRYWKTIYSSDEFVQPDVVILPFDEMNGIKKADSGNKIQVLDFPDILSPDEYELFSKIHQTNLKRGDVQLEDLTLAWEQIASELKI